MHCWQLNIIFSSKIRTQLWVISSPLKSFPILVNCKLCTLKRELVEEMPETEWDRTG